jgi:hypothetical protein
MKHGPNRQPRLRQDHAPRVRRKNRTHRTLCRKMCDGNRMVDDRALRRETNWLSGKLHWLRPVHGIVTERRRNKNWPCWTRSLHWRHNDRVRRLRHRGGTRSLRRPRRHVPRPRLLLLRLATKAELVRHCFSRRLLPQIIVRRERPRVHRLVAHWPGAIRNHLWALRAQRDDVRAVGQGS